MSGDKYDTGKPPIHLVPLEALEGVAHVMGYGAQKYAPYNWMKGFTVSRLYSATMRHMLRYWGREDVDEESGLHPLDHAIAELMMLRALMLRNKLEDDRPPQERIIQ